MSDEDRVFSTQKITPQLVAQIIEALKDKAYGSVEIYVEKYSVVQITQRTITKLRPLKNDQLRPKANNQINQRFQLKIQKFD